MDKKENRGVSFIEEARAKALWQEEALKVQGTINKYDPCG